MTSNNTVGQKSNGTPFLLRILIVLAVLGIMVTLLPATSGVVQADYDTAPTGGDTFGGDDV